MGFVCWVFCLGLFGFFSLLLQLIKHFMFPFANNKLFMPCDGKQKIYAGATDYDLPCSREEQALNAFAWLML